MGDQGDLKEYHEKRNTAKSGEPQGKSSPSGKKLKFVIQKHDATNLHYDFRLEIAGTLKSWAVPKGPSTDPKVKRLAIQTEDHPMDYRDFEGVIPEGEYGAGTVMVWDRGTYRPLDQGKQRSFESAWKGGHLTFWLNGKKLQGGYALTRTQKKKWLLVKMDDEKADARRNPVSTQNKSVKSGRTLHQIQKKS